MKTLTGHRELVETVVFSPDGKIIASAGEGKVNLWNLQGKLIKTLTDRRELVESVVFSPDGKTIASAGEGKVNLWNLQGQKIVTFRRHHGAVESVRFSPDGKTIASASADKTIKLWNFNLDLDDLLIEGCNWVRDYLKYNNNLSEEDRHLCGKHTPV